MAARSFRWLVVAFAFLGWIVPDTAWAEEVCGEYLFVKDSDGAKPGQGSTIKLRLRDGQAKITASKPGTELQDRGSYKLLSGRRITIRFREMEFGARKKRYRQQAGLLILPFRVLSSGTSGSSSWQLVQGCGAAGGREPKGGDDGGGSRPGGGDSQGGTGRPGDPGSTGGTSDDGSSQRPRPGTHEYGQPGGEPMHLIHPPANAGKGSKLSDYVGHWAGVGWGWELRFKESRKGFASKVLTGKKDTLGLSSKGKDGTLMSLTVQHAVHFAISVDENGEIKGRGQITYSLYPNLCGVAALTRMVNDQINFLTKLPEIYELGTQIGTSMLKRYNADWLAEESKLADMIDSFRTSEPGDVMRKYWATSRSKTYKVEITDGRSLGQAIVNNVCSNYSNFKVVGGMGCGSFLGALGTSRPTKLLAAEEIEKVIYDALKKPIASGLNKAVTGESQTVFGDTKQKEMLCTLAPETFGSGNKIGPDTMDEFLLDQAKAIPDVFEALSSGKLPVDFMLNIPGVTKVQYYYKGLSHGPETRSFDIKGHLIMTGAGPRMVLEMGRLRSGSKQLDIEWTVNYKKERAHFPIWSPFLSDPAYVRTAGVRTRYDRKEEILKKKMKNPKTGKMETLRYKRTKTFATDTTLKTPFATFYDKGTHRDGVKPWHDYEYYWTAYKITEPVVAPSSKDPGLGLELE